MQKILKNSEKKLKKNLNLFSIFNFFKKMDIFSLKNGPFEIIKNMIIFEDERMHVIFLDRTSLIIHSGAVCGTFFKADNKSLRFFLNVPPMKEDLTFKIESALAVKPKMLFFIENSII